MNDFEELKQNGIMDDQYGLCTPKYSLHTKEYLKINDVRITIDENIFYRVTRKKTVNDNDSIIELKTNFNKNVDDLIKEFPFQKIRFSKYCQGITTII